MDLLQLGRCHLTIEATIACIHDEIDGLAELALAPKIHHRRLTAGDLHVVAPSGAHVGAFAEDVPMSEAWLHATLAHPLQGYPEAISIRKQNLELREQ